MTLPQSKPQVEFWFKGWPVWPGLPYFFLCFFDDFILEHHIMVHFIPVNLTLSCDKTLCTCVSSHGSRLPGLSDVWPSPIIHDINLPKTSQPFLWTGCMPSGPDMGPTFLKKKSASKFPTKQLLQMDTQLSILTVKNFETIEDYFFRWFCLEFIYLFIFFIRKIFSEVVNLWSAW